MNVLLIMGTASTHATIFPVATHVAVIQDTCSIMMEEHVEVSINTVHLMLVSYMTAFYLFRY